MAKETTKKPTVKNGKGSTPRNLSNKYRDNYTSIFGKKKK